MYLTGRYYSHNITQQCFVHHFVQHVLMARVVTFFHISRYKAICHFIQRSAYENVNIVEFCFQFVIKYSNLF